MTYIDITPVDTLFFRDGQPFNAGEAGQMEVASHFPPSPDTVVGMLRAAFARQLGWQQGAWGQEIINQLGSHECLDPLRFCGPYLCKDNHLLFPFPLHLMLAGDPRDEEISMLLPSEQAVSTDIGRVCLPKRCTNTTTEQGQGFKVPAQAYLTAEGMQAVLAGALPKARDVLHHQALWASETRAGIARDNLTSVVHQGQFYQSSHTRLMPGVSLCVGVHGYEGDIPTLATLGGESRMVGLEPHSGDIDTVIQQLYPDCEPQGDTLRYTVVLLTPTKVVDERWRSPSASHTLPGLPGKVISACVGKPTLIGGWNSVKKYPKPLEPYLPAGSVFFMEAASEHVDAIRQKHGGFVGERNAWGYGQILIGTWQR